MLDSRELHAAKCAANSASAKCSQYLASASSLLSSTELYAAHWRHIEPIARNRQTLFIVSPLNECSTTLFLLLLQSHHDYRIELIFSICSVMEAAKQASPYGRALPSYMNVIGFGPGM